MKSLFSLSLIVLLCVLGYMPSTAQQYFNKRYTSGANANIFASALEQNKRYYVIMGGIDSSNYIGGGLFKTTTCLKFLVLDSIGTIITSKLYKRDDKKETFALPAGFTVSNNFISLSDGTFIYAVASIDTVLAPYNPTYLNTQMAIIRFDSLGNVLMYKEYDRVYCYPTDPTNHLLADFKPDAYGNWLMLSTMLCNGNKVVFNLRKLDSSFNEIWVKNFTTSSFLNIPKHLLIEDDGYVMTGGIDNGNAKLHPDYYTSLLIKCDTAGNKLWHWQNDFDTTKLQYIINDIIKTKDGGYVYCGTGEGKPMHYATGEWTDILTKGWVEKLDASRNSVWKTKIGTVRASIKATQQTVIKELPNGDLIVAGTLGVLYDKTDEAKGWIRGSLTRLNGVDGSIIWQRQYKSPDNNDTMYLSIYDMRPTADGGYILAGETRNVIDRGNGPIQRGWLIKVDSNGCEWAGSPCNPTNINSPSRDSTFCSIYPNPSNGDFTVKFNSSNKSNAQLFVFDIVGRLLWQQSITMGLSTIPAKDWASGVYLYHVSQNGKTLYNGKLIKQ